MYLKKNKPNIVLIMTDDHGYWAMGCAGNEEIHTPNLDRLASSGILFNNFFCVSPVCSPARASLFTGKIPSQHGIHDWIHKGHADESQLSEGLKQILNQENVEEKYKWVKNQIKGDKAIDYLKGHTCFTEILAQNGYTCGLSGKWHMGNSGKPQAGFSYWKTIAMGGDHYYTPTVLIDGEFVMLENKYLTDYITENALEFLSQNKNKENPFYLSVHYTAPHSPWGKDEHPKKYYELYENCPFESVPNEPTHPWSIYKNQTPKQEKRARYENLKGYYTAVTAMDEGVGKILDYLEEYHLLEDTIIFFTSDNGMSMGHHGIFGKGNGTYPLNMYDTAVKVPAILSYPKVLPKNMKSNLLISHYDVMPTLINYLGLEHDLNLQELPGRNLASLLEGKKLDEEGNIVIMDEYGPTRMIRNKEWKYIHRYPEGPCELYHLAHDPDEKYNLVDDNKYKTVKEELKHNLEQWFERYIDVMEDGKKQRVTGNGQIGKRTFK